MSKNTTMRILLLILVIVFIFLYQNLSLITKNIPLPMIEIIALSSLGITLILGVLHFILKRKIHPPLSTANARAQYLMIPSKTPNAWILYLVLTVVFLSLGKFSDFFGFSFLGVIFALLFIFQALYNLFRIKK